MKNPALAYRQMSVQGATPLGMVVMLYDGAIAALRRAVVATEARDIQEKCTHLARAQAIILQLEGSLNFSQGSEVAKTLKAFYVYARGQILRANLENSPEALRSLIEKIIPIREAWNAADQRPAEAGGTLPPPEGDSEARGGNRPPAPAHALENPQYASVLSDESFSSKFSA